MNKSERRNYLIDSLLEEKKEYKKIVLSQSADEQKTLLRSLMNIRMAAPISEAFLQTQDEYLKEETKSKGITDNMDLRPFIPSELL